MADLTDQITQAADEPLAAESDGQSAQARPMSDLIKADQYLAARAGMRKRNRGVYFSKLLPAGPVSDNGASRQDGFGRGGCC